MDHNNPPPVRPQPYYAQQQGGQQANQLPPFNMASPTYGQEQGQQVQVTGTRISLAVMLEYIARGGAILTTFLASVIVGASKQTVIVGLLLNTESSTLKFSDYAALKYFLAANIIVLFYSIASLVMSIIIKSKTLILKLSNTIADIVAVSLLLTANGAASAMSTQLDNIDHLFEESPCSTFDKFCSHVKASIAMSMLAVGLYLALIILTLLNFANKKN